MKETNKVMVGIWRLFAAAIITAKIRTGIQNSRNMLDFNIFRELFISVNRPAVTYFFRTNRTHRVPGPQWQETVQPARVS